MKNTIQNRLLLTLRNIKDLFILFEIQLIISFISFGVFSWRLAEAFKISIYDYLGVKLYAWVDIFFNPYESNLINYIFLCIATGLYSLLIYYILLSKKTHKLLEKEVGWINKKLFVGIIIGSSILFILASRYFVTYRTLPLCLIAFIPALHLFSNNLKVKLKIDSIGNRIRSVIIFENRGRSIRDITGTLLGILLLIICLEPLYLLNGSRPVYLVNEYDIYSATILDSGVIKNEVFLNGVKDSDLDTADVESTTVPTPSQWMMPPTLVVKPYTILQNLRTLILDLAAKDINTNNTPQELHHADYKEIPSFVSRNFLENIFHNMSRGQMNHIGHILNPINEYMLGKSIKEIYFQYGMGNTFIMKWTMELFGGISIDNYYKCYIFYLFYYLTFLLMVFVLFKDSGYVLCCFAVLAFAFFYQGYIGFIIAPGIIPTIHMFDAPVFILVLLFFRQNRLIYLIFAIVFSVLSIMVNQQFGVFLVASLIASLLLFANENRDGKTKKIWLLGIFFTAIIGITVYYLVSSKLPGNKFFYFLTGLFSWRAHRIIILLTIVYLTISYFLMFILKESRSYLKYIYLMIFVYTQGLFVYYYWAGLSNHLPTVMPFVGVQVFLVFYMIEKGIIPNTMFGHKIPSLFRVLSISILLVIILQNATIFYRQKALFLNNFASHRTYKWNYDRARLTTTINPEPINEGVSMIRRYSVDEPGIYIISRYDNLLPFLAERYSLMPFFEMSWHLFSDQESYEVIEMLRNRKPKYLFVDSNMGVENYLWDKLYPTFYNESAARRGRNEEMYKVFMAVGDDYEKVEKGALLSVYRRKH